jgi:transposase InsO family protein
VGRQAKWGYFRAIYQRYRWANRQEKGVMLDEFCRVSGYQGEFAIRRLSGPPPGRLPDRPARRKRQPRCGPQVVSVLAAVWEAAGYPWSVRLKALLPLWMPWARKRFRLGAAAEQKLLAISPRQIDRRLRDRKRQLRRRLYGRTKPGTLLKHQIPIKTDCRDVDRPGFAEIDLVSHPGNSADGEFAHTLNLTDIHTTWTESRAVLGKGQTAVKAALDQVQSDLPFRLLGLDSDNGSEFINWHLQGWCEQRQIQLTRGRPYKKDDNAHIEQKNWTHVRKLLGWERYDSPEAVEAINDLYRNELRLLLNLFLPGVKSLRKMRVGSKLRRVYDPPRTPLERVIVSPQHDRQPVAELLALRSRLDPFELSRAVDRKLELIYRLANRRWRPKATPEPASGDRKKRRNGCGKVARGKPRTGFPVRLEISQTRRDFHFPTAAATTAARLHLKWLDRVGSASDLQCVRLAGKRRVEVR